MTVVTWTLRLLDWFGKYLPNTSLPVLPAPTIPQSPSMVLAEMVALELLKCDYHREVKNRRRSEKNPRAFAYEDWEDSVSHPKFSITFYHKMYYYDEPMFRGSREQYTLYRTEIITGSYTFTENSDEQKIILKALGKADQMKAEHIRQAKAAARQLEAVDAIEAWCKTDPKLLTEE